MVDTSILRSLLEAIAGGTKIILVGDVNQLPPVGHGAPLRDMIRSNRIPYVELTEVRRNAGAIVHGCRSIMLGQMPEFEGNLEFTHCQSNHIERMVCFLQDHAGEVDPVWDSQALVATNETGPVSKVKVNEALQVEFCRAERKEGYPFRETDKVVCNKNSTWRVCLDRPFSDEATFESQKGVETVLESYVANGEVAEVVDVTDGEMLMEIRNPQRTVIVKKGMKHFWELAYALTCHKSQGSEYHHCLVALDPYGMRVCSREWIYTAISRAKQHCNLFGLTGTLEQFISYTAIDERTTLLAEQLYRELEHEQPQGLPNTDMGSREV